MFTPIRKIFSFPSHFFFIVYMMFVVQEKCEEGKPIGGQVGDWDDELQKM
jgi:hypothetical protein